MVVMPSVAIDLPTTEGCRHELESPQALLALDNNEPRLHLPSQTHVAVLLDGTAEAAFAVDEADDPLLDSWPFLLIARTRRIVTEHAFYHTRSVPRDARVFQHLASCTLDVTAKRGSVEAPCLETSVHLRTVIVTAAVYRGLGSELRLAANPSP